MNYINNLNGETIFSFIFWFLFFFGIFYFALKAYQRKGKEGYEERDN